MFIYLTDDEATLYKDSGEYIFSGPWDDALSHLDEVTQKVSLLIDLSHPDIREDKLPSLYIWDRIRLLHHKRAELSGSGDYFGAHIIKEGNERYLRSVHIPRKDPLKPFLLKAGDSVYFVPLEAHRYLDEIHAPYKILVYSLPNGKVRHIVFQGKRMLLSRVVHSEEDLKTSLHYLSRTHADIFEMFHVKHLEDVKSFLQFVASQKHPILPFNQKSSVHILMRISGFFAGVFFLSLMLYEAYQALSFKNKALNVSSSLNSLKSKIEALKQDNESRSKRFVLNHSIYLKSLEPNFLKTVQDLFIVLEKHHIRLTDLDWRKGKELDLTLTFLKADKLYEQLDPFLASLKTAFPDGQIEVIEAPYHSSNHEVFKGMTNNPPLSHVRVVME